MATRISKNFTLEEFTASSTAKANGITNVPSTQQVANLCALVHNVLQPLRDAMGHEIKIGSGYRCPRLNAAVGGVSNSQHMNGEAADFYVGWNGPKEKAPSRRELLIKAFRQIITDEHINFDQCIIYPSFIHVSYVHSGRKNRRKLTRGFSNGTYAALSHAQAMALE